MAEITVEQTEAGTYRVTVMEPAGSTVHEVTADPATLGRLGAGVAPVHVVEASFRFLLDREPKESILRRFDIDLISHYFPEYPSVISDYL